MIRKGLVKSKALFISLMLVITITPFLINAEEYQPQDYTLLDSHSPIYFDCNPILVEGNPDIGQTFTTPEGTRYYLKQAQFYIDKDGDPSGNLTAYLYNTTFYGVYYNITGSPLAQSETVINTSINTTAHMHTFNFTGNEQYYMLENHTYAIVLNMTDFSHYDVMNETKMGANSTGDSHNGTEVSYYSGNWTVWYLSDIIFSVYGDTEGPDELEGWVFKQGYDNCTHGVPDFDCKQDGHNETWSFDNAILGVDQWYMDGPTALLDCYWWLDCKYNNNTKNYMLNDYTGQGSKDPSNVEMQIEALSYSLNTTYPSGVVEAGTSVANFTAGLYQSLEANGINNTVCVTVEGYDDTGSQTREPPTFDNISSHIRACDDVIILLGFYCTDGMGSYWRTGGHYVQCNGYYNEEVMALSFSDPYYDNAELNGWGWNSSHNHDLYGNGSHNWTENVSYDFYSLDDSAPLWYWGMGSLVVENYPATNETCTLTDCWDLLNWWGDITYSDDACVDCRTEIDVVWYISTEYNFSVNKTVWNGSAWIEHYNTSTLGEDVQFNITITNLGHEVNESYNITILDTYYDALNYTPDSTQIITPNGVIYREPIVSYEGPSCYVDWAHGHATWELNFTEYTFGYNDKIYILFNCTINNTHYSDNLASLYLYAYDEEWYDGVLYDSDRAWVNEIFNTSIVRDLHGDEWEEWIISEHVKRPCIDNCSLDETWYRYSSERETWSIYEDLDQGWMYRCEDNSYDGINATDDDGLSYVIADNSSTNRSQSLVWCRINFSYLEGGPEINEDPFIGVIYSYRNHSHFDCVIVGYTDTPYVSLVSVRDGLLFDTPYGWSLRSVYDSENYWVDDWSTNETFNEEFDAWDEDGVWIKTIYNEHTGRIQTKVWEPYNTTLGLCEEPAGWIYDNYSSSILSNYSTAFGLVVINEYGYNMTADFDWIEDFRLNYSYDKDATAEQISNKTSAFDKGIPLMEFNGIDYWEDYYSQYEKLNDCYAKWESEQLTDYEYHDCVGCVYRNVSYLGGKVSREYDPVVNESDYITSLNQNDTVYYTSGLIYNNTESDITEGLFIMIEDCTDGTNGSYDGAVVCIDVDNDQSWDDNDICVMWYDDGTLDPAYVIWNGTYKLDDDFNGSVELDLEATFVDCILDVNDSTWMPALHRYKGHRVHSLILPRWLLHKNHAWSYDLIDAGDTFGLNVMRFYEESGEMGPEKAFAWSNWNETNADYPWYSANESKLLNTWDIFMNISYDMLDEFILDGIWLQNLTDYEIQNWGHGRIDPSLELQDDYWVITANKTVNDSVIEDVSILNWLNFTINVTNTGTENVTNVTVIDTFPSEVNYFSSSLPESEVTLLYGNTYQFNMTDLIGPYEWETFNIIVNLSAGCALNGTILTNSIEVTTNESNSASDDCDFRYGLNNPPTINWTYPSDTQTDTPLLLSDITFNIYDLEGSNMDLYVYSNKTIYWTGSYYLIAENISVVNGSYFTNQTFTDSDTKWRWGNTTYYLRINATDGTAWTNTTITYVTDTSRYDMNYNDYVTVQDLSFAWAHRDGQTSYDGLYDVNNNDHITVQDLSYIWANRS